MNLSIVQVGEPVLREKARALTRDEILGRTIQDLIRDMREAMHVINPVLTPVPAPDAAPPEFYEGCLSLAGFSALVPRARAVRVECLDERARPRAIEASGWHARILQHEVDHLQGILYIDRMRVRSFTSLDNWTRFWKGKPIAEIRSTLER